MTMPTENTGSAAVEPSAGHDLARRLQAMADGWKRCPTGPAGWLATGELLAEAARRVADLEAAIGRLRKVAGELEATHVGMEIPPGTPPSTYYDALESAQRDLFALLPEQREGEEVQYGK